MTFNPLFHQVLPVAYWLLPIALIATILKTQWFKGLWGEALVTFFGWLLLSAKVYPRLNNGNLYTPDGTTQIDHIFVSRFGIFVVETKNMQGWIFGSEHQAHWTQWIYKKSFRFQNPLRQNYKHVKALESLLDVSPDTIHSVVVFTGSSTFKTRMPMNVTKAGGYIRYIKSLKTPVFTETEVQDIINRIKSGRLAPTRATHPTIESTQKSRSGQTLPKVWKFDAQANQQRGGKCRRTILGLLRIPKMQDYPDIFLN